MCDCLSPILNLNLKKSRGQSSFMSVVHQYIYIKRSKTCGRASSDKGSDSFSHPQTRFSTPQCNYTAVFASSRSVFTARLAVSCLSTIQSFLRSYSLSALCLWVLFFFCFFVSSIGNRENHNNRELCQTRQEHKGKE